MDAERDWGRFLAGINLLAATYNREVSKPLLDAYWLVLSSRRIEDFEAACAAALGKCQFMPVPAELKKLSFSAAAKRQGVAFIEGTGWISLDGNQERNGYHPDLLDAGADKERARLEAIGREPPQLEAIKGGR